jgi:hypothetical protein
MFAVLVGTMHLQHFQQTMANNWKRTATDPRRFHFHCCIAAICGSCGQTFAAPPSLDDAVIRS